MLWSHTEVVAAQHCEWARCDWSVGETGLTSCSESFTSRRENTRMQNNKMFYKNKHKLKGKKKHSQRLEGGKQRVRGTCVTESQKVMWYSIILTGALPSQLTPVCHVTQDRQTLYTWEPNTALVCCLFFLKKWYSPPFFAVCCFYPLKNEVCPEGIQPRIMKNRNIYWRKYKKHCT